MTTKCAWCGSADTQTGLAAVDCLTCGGTTVDGQQDRPPEGSGVTTSRDDPKSS